MADEQIFGKNEAEIELTLREKLQDIAKQATDAATTWADGWRNERVTVKRKVMNKLDAQLEAMILAGLGLQRYDKNTYTTSSSQSKGNWDVISRKVEMLVKAEIAERLTEDYIKKHQDYDRIMASAEKVFWRAFEYKMDQAARTAGERAAEATKAQFENSLTTLVKRSVLDHFAASDGLAELEEEERRK